MANHPKYGQHSDRRYTFRRTKAKQRDARLSLQYELLESRHLLASDIGSLSTLNQASTSRTPAALTWFESMPSVQRVELSELHLVDQVLAEGVYGPQGPAIGEWIIELTAEASQKLRTLAQANDLLNETEHHFDVISGLGFQGGLLVRGEGFSKASLEAALEANANVKSFSLNQLIQGQATTPTESDFAAGLLPGLEKINATTAWDQSIGSMNTVVGVVDSGIDPTHPDLYLNIWINQGELPLAFLDDDGNKLIDIDSDGLITFYDLNNATRATTAPYALTVAGYAAGPNAEFVKDLNNNGRIDADDLLRDPLWTSGSDDDDNGFFDDIFGVNFRAGADDPFASSNPTDELGHGTHVAGTIGAIGSNGTGVVGVNWQTSLMSLRILDNNNQGDSGAAIRALNYAREMRERLETNSANRVTKGAAVKVLNNSWGQPGGYEASLEAAIKDLYDANILFVAAAGNGNILGQGVDNDRTPFYPASYDVPNVIAVAAADANDRLATFSNYGKTSVDILAPGVGIRSTVPGGGYQSANGTSMATPHVSGTAALIWSALPESTVDEVKQAILGTATRITQNGVVSTNGFLNAADAIDADVFAPAARIIEKHDISTIGSIYNDFTVEYSHRSGIDINSIGDDDLLATRNWGPREVLPVKLVPGTVRQTEKAVLATYRVAAPGGTWDALDYGDYSVTSQKNKVNALGSYKTTANREIGSFRVQISNDVSITGSDPSIIYVTTTQDSLKPGTLRSAIIQANAANSPRTIILNRGRYTISIPSMTDPLTPFSALGKTYANPNTTTTWSNEQSGDFDITGNIFIVGDQNSSTLVDAQGIDRVFKVHPNATLTLKRIAVIGGVSPGNQGGGGILSAGNVALSEAVVANNKAVASANDEPMLGGGVAVWSGSLNLRQSWVNANESNYGGGIYYGGLSYGDISQSTISNNVGGGFHSHSDTDISISNSTFSNNTGGSGAIFNGKRNITSNDYRVFSSIVSESNSYGASSDGRFVAFSSSASTLVFGDTNGLADVFVYDRIEDRVELISQPPEAVKANGNSISPKISGDGRFVVFVSTASNLVPNDTNGIADIFLYDRTTKTTTRVNVSNVGTQADRASAAPVISGNGRYVAFESFATNLVAGDSNAASDIFVYDQQLASIERISVSSAGIEGNFSSNRPSLSSDGMAVAFDSRASNLVANDTNNVADVFVFNRSDRTLERLSVDSTGIESNGASTWAILNADGSDVFFKSFATNLVPASPAGLAVYAINRESRSAQRIGSVVSSVNDFTPQFAIDYSGKVIAFTSIASDLVPGDTNNTADVFVLNRDSGIITRASVSNAGAQASRGATIPVVSGDSSVVLFASISDDLFRGDTNKSDNLFARDLVSEGLAPVPAFSQSFVNAAQLTIVSTSGSTYSVAGNVRLSDSLLVNDIRSHDNIVSTSNIMDRTTEGVSLISKLTQHGPVPPVHSLLFGNPAIDAGSPSLTGTSDQLGSTRSTPDIGAVEIVSASLAGKVYIDLNRNQKLDATESSIADSKVTLVSRDGFHVQSTDSSGSFLFPVLPVNPYLVSVEAPPNFQLPKTPLKTAFETPVANGNIDLSALRAYPVTVSSRKSIFELRLAA